PLAAGIEHPIVSYQAVVASDLDSHEQVVVEPVVFDQVSRPPVHVDAGEESTHVAMTNGGVLAVRGRNARCGRVVASRQASDLVIVAVDSDVVRRDRDGATAGDRGAQVLAQAPFPLFGDDRGKRVDEAGTAVVARRGKSGARDDAKPEQQGCEDGHAADGHAWFSWGRRLVQFLA